MTCGSYLRSEVRISVGIVERFILLLYRGSGVV